jgi:hypothetical protein
MKIDSAADCLRHIMSECEGHRFGQPNYDITLDDIYDTADAALAHLGYDEDVSG